MVDNSPCYAVQQYRRDLARDAPLATAIKTPLFSLLNEYGQEFSEFWTPGLNRMLFETDAYDGVVILGACVTIQHAPTLAPFVAHACIVINSVSSVGIFSFVITSKQHRRKGLARMVCTQVLADMDLQFPQSAAVLSTSSPHAAKLYQSLGFAHLAGGLGCENTCSDPDSKREWIMMRQVGNRLQNEGNNAQFFQVGHYYTS
jgi:hypothetical protein